LHLDEDLSGSPGKHGGRHPLPDPQAFAARLAGLGVGLTTPVVAYDDARLAFAARLWWLMRSLGYRPPLLLDGGYAGYLASGGPVQTAVPGATPCETTVVGAFSGYCDIDGLRQLQQQGALVIDSREERRYLGLEEPIDPVAGHIPAALSRPWQGVTAADGTVRDVAGQRAHWGDVVEADNLVVYCGSGVTACVNLFSLSLLGRDDATLYAGSWSDWCSHM
jgi:thiosulfate/3-mercaptopyruvate sulfurtransferase